MSLIEFGRVSIVAAVLHVDGSFQRGGRLDAINSARI